MSRTTMYELRQWFDHGVSKGATHLIVVCDTFDYDDYPVYVGADEDFYAEYDRFNGKNMQQVMEVYDLRKPWPTVEGRVFDMPARAQP